MESKLLANISNADLLSALNYSNEKRIADFYCDLDFGVGKITTKSLFATTFSPVQTRFTIPSSRWVKFEELATTALHFVTEEIFSPSIVEAREKFEVEFKRWRSPANQSLLKEILSTRAQIEFDLLSFVESSGQVISDALTEEIKLDNVHRSTQVNSKNELTLEESRRLHKIRETNTTLQTQLHSLQESRQTTMAVYDRIGAIIDDCDAHAQQILAEVAILKSTAKKRLSGLLKDLAAVRNEHKQLSVRILKRVEEPDFEITIDGRVLVRGIEAEKDWIAERVSLLSQGGQSPTEIREFFSRCQDLFKFLESMFDDKYFSSVLLPENSTDDIELAPSQRISMPLRDVFATGIHCAVYGEAGAGKSTTLHQYAAYASGRDPENELTLFLPLTRILAEKILPPESSPLSPVQKLESCLSSFLVADKAWSPAEMANFIKGKRRVTFIFDGVDEVVKRTPWILEAIEGVEKTYANCQIILSSRMSGRYTDEIQYLGLTLLPFTDEQVLHFIRGWFTGRPELAEDVKKHLEKAEELREIVRSPLLATILCVLAENNVPLPEGELSMYAERFKLLFGHYDIHKKTRRVDSHHSALEVIARKLAFYLHSRNVRSATLKDLEKAAVRIAGRRSSMSEAHIRLAVHELVDPCNVLVPMTADGDFGFGHLRYQEYLSATEICANRGIDLGPLLSSPWWRSVLTLFAKMTDDISYVLEDVLEKGLKVTKCKENLLAMFETKSKSEQKHLQEIVEDHVKLDIWDADLQDYDDDDLEWR